MSRIVSLLCAAVVMIGIVTLTPAIAQQAQTANIFTFDLFTGDSVADLDPDEARKLLDAARQAQVPGDCPLGRITVLMPKGHVEFQMAMGNARRDVVLQLLNVNGIDPSRFFADVRIIGGENTGNDAQLEYTPPDKEPPRLNVTSTPEKGKKVRANERITVRAIARDDANPWQTGIMSIDLTAEGGGPFGFQDYALACDRPSPPRTLQGVYTVPANPPPLVRLRATAKDFAGNEIDLLADFPTGDWYGKFNWNHNCEGFMTDNTRGISDLALTYDGRGNLTGTLVGSIPEREQIIPTFTSFTYLAPGTFSAKLVGSYTPGQESFSAQAIDSQTTPGRASWTSPAGSHVDALPFFTAYEGEMFGKSFRDLRRQPDGDLKSNGESTVSVGGSTCKTSYTLTLKQAQS